MNDLDLLQKKFTGLRILHYLSPVRWKGKRFLHESDSNYKVMMKTVDWLPYCHHYIVVPENNNIVNTRKNVTLLTYNYGTNAMNNKINFNIHKFDLNLKIMDIDYIFNHQPELSANLFVLMDHVRNNNRIKIFSFFHWVDCKESRPGFNQARFSPLQLSSMVNSDMNFFHSYEAYKYLLRELARYNIHVRSEDYIHKVSYMPLSSKMEDESVFIDLPKDKKILVFNHRFRSSSGRKLMLEFIKELSDDYYLWITDGDNEDLPKELRRPILNSKQYKYLLENCYASICFINGYSTWNLAIQDPVLVGKPLVAYKHSIIDEVVGKDYPFQFESVEEFKQILARLPEKYDWPIQDHDLAFKNNLLESIDKVWKEVDFDPLHLPGYKKCLKEGIRSKEMINQYTTKLKLSNGFVSVRHWLLQNGFVDNYEKANTTYYTEEEFEDLKSGKPVKNRMLFH